MKQRKTNFTDRVKEWEAEQNELYSSKNNEQTPPNAPRMKLNTSWLTSDDDDSFIAINSVGKKINKKKTNS